MSRITKWKLEKTKVKVVFRLQFHATHIPQSGWDKLFVSFIPADSGKATAKTTKANVKNGTCKWADPIYETTRLLQDIKTKRYDEKLYKLVITMGSSRSSILGEATINLADYADALKPSVIAMPLHGGDSGAILHVTVQLLTSKTGFREFEQQREFRERGLQMDQSPDESSGRKVLSSEDAINDQIDKANTRVRFQEKPKDLASLEEEVGLNEEYAESAVGFDGSSNTSESLYAEKHDTSSTHEIDSLKSTVSGDLAGLSSSQSPQLEKGDPSDHRFLAQGTNDWVHGWSSDYSADNDLAAAYEENSRLRGSLEVAESSILDLKLEVSSLQSQADEIGYEAQKFAKQLAAEIASGEELAREVSLLQSDCSKLKDDLERLKISKLCLPFSSRAVEAEQDCVFHDLQLRWVQGILTMEDKIRELQNKACFGYHERDTRFLQSDLEALHSALQNLKQGTALAVSNFNSVPSEGASLKERREVTSQKNGQFVMGTGFDVDLYQPELGMLHCLSIPGLVSHEQDSMDAANAMKGKIFELLRELDESKGERESLAKKMDQMECYYEALVQELEENQRQMLGELQNLRNEHSNCLYTVSSTKAEMEAMCQDLNGEILRLAEDKRDLDSLNKVLERRTITAEAALKRARLNYSIAVDQLQKDLELLSFQVLSMFETNENIIRKTFVDSEQSCFQGLTEMAEDQKFDSREFHAAKSLQIQNQLVGVKKHQLGGDTLLDDLKRSLHLQEGLYQKIEEEVCELHFVNIYLDVLSKSLQETLLEVSHDVELQKEIISELTQQLQLSTESKELLMQKLQIAMDDVDSLNEYKATCIAKCSDVALQNQILKSDLQNLSCENHLLVQKITEWESLLVCYKTYESKYETCAEEKTELACLLENKTLDNSKLQNEIFSLQEELKTVKIEFDQLASAKENMDKFINFLQNKLQNLLASYGKCINVLPPFSEYGIQDLESRDLTDLLMQLEEHQHNACEKILQLMDEKKGLVHERDVAQVSITAAESEIAMMKKNFGRDLWTVMDKLDVSNSLVQKLQLDIETIANRLRVSSEVEEKYAQQHSQISAYLDRLEVELQELTTKNRDLVHEILALKTVTSESERDRLTVVELLKASLQNKNEESTKLASELNTVKESLQSLQDENKALTASSQGKMEESAQLASQLNILKDSLQSLCDENQALMASSRDQTEEASKLASELNILKHNFQSLHNENLTLMECARGKTEESAKLTLELNNLGETMQCLYDEKKTLMASSRDKMEESSKLESEIIILKESLRFVHDENKALMATSQDKMEESAKLASEIKSLKESLQSLHDEKQDLLRSLQEKTEESSKLAFELNSSKESLRFLHDENKALIGSSFDKMEESTKLVSEMNSLKESWQSLHNENLALMASLRDTTEESAKHALELNSLKENLQSQRDENQAFVASSRDKTEEFAKLVSELNSARDTIQSLHDELQDERSLRDGLLSTNNDLTSQLDEKQCQLLLFGHHEDELVHLKELVMDLESEKSRVCHLLLHYEECLKKAHEESTSVAGLESQLTEMHEHLIARDIRLIFTKTEYEGRVEMLVQQLYASDRQLTEIHKKHIDAETMLNCCIASEAQYIEENFRLLTSLESLRSELEASIAENRSLLEANKDLRAELEENTNGAHNGGLSCCEETCEHSLEVGRLNCMLVSSDEEIDSLVLSKEELEVKVLVLKTKFDEQQVQVVSLAACYDELMLLQKQCNELTQRLSEQILKTEEFRNLSVHLKELKDKADAECVQAREKREPEWPPVAMQESLRIAFIKEQYENKLQELKHQLSVSKKHSEEMLWKLQDAIDEIENRKRSEASHLKKNEELGMKILELEAELQSFLSDNREKMKACDLMKAEMECSLISLECCKEENQKLEAYLRECNEEKSRAEAELTLVKELLENFKAAHDTKVEGNCGRCKMDCMPSNEPVFRNIYEKDPVADNLSYRSMGGDPILKYLKQDTSRNFEEPEYACPAHVDEVDHSSTLINGQPEQLSISNGFNGVQSPEDANQEKLLHIDTKNLALINDHFRAENLKSSMDHLRNELERMKNENSLLQDNHDFDKKFPGLQGEFMQLQKANEELGSMFPLFNELSGSGNALERVLALELELADALQAKKKSSIHFQSSFLKQHSDEEAVFKSFRDINELIKDMLEMKERYAAVETELREMHDRYSQLSLQFAEVEGERQKLIMTLKNVRASKKAQYLNRSSSASPGDHSLQPS